MKNLFNSTIEFSISPIFAVIIILLLIAIFVAVYVVSARKRSEQHSDMEIEKSNYKKAVLAEAIIILEINLSKNIIVDGTWKDKNGNCVPLEKILGISVPCSYDGYIKLWNRKFVNSNSSDEFSGSTDRNHLLKLFKDGKSEITFDYEAKTIDGVQAFLRRSICMVRNEKSGDIIAYTNVKNVTDTVAKEMKNRDLIKEALSQAEEANKAKTVFLSNMSHDIRTPMNAIIGFTGLALNHIDDKEQTENYLKKIQASSNHMLALIDDLLDMSRIESGKISLDEDECTIPGLVNDIKDMMVSAASAKKQTITVDTSSVSDSNVKCDKLKINQVFLNLLSNAVKYTPNGGKIDIRVIQRQFNSDGRINYEFRIKDNGIGMSEEFLKHIYEPFKRESNAETNSIQGTGLGMSITKNLIDMMNGTIEVSSRVGDGTEFIVTLPLQKSANLNQNFADGNKSRSTLTTDFKGKKILLVDDNDLNREIAVDILSDGGFNVEEAENGKKAIEKLIEKGAGYYTLVLMDVQMPVMDGYEATRQIRKLDNQGIARIPIIAMTANAFAEDKKAAFAAGMNEHLAKPVSVEKLFETIERVYKDLNNK